MKRVIGIVGVFFAAALWAAPIKVACIGDSITYGYNVKNFATESYPAQLQQMLGDGYEVKNFGNSGRGVFLHSKRGANEMRGFFHMKEHQAALEWQPDIVICNLGINDGEEFMKLGAEAAKRFEEDYIKLLETYKALPTNPKLYIWGKLAPLAPGQKFYRSPAPFLMQPVLRNVAEKTGATLIDMQEPLRPYMLTEFPDKLHPTAAGHKVIAEATYAALTAKPAEPVSLPNDLTDKKPEIWLCAGQSNMAWKLKQCVGAKEEANKTANVDIRLWDYTTGTWHKLTPQNAVHWSSMAVSFAIRRAEASKKPVCILYVAAGGAPTEAFLSEEVMAAWNWKNNRPKYPKLCKIVTNRKQIDQNEDFPCVWCQREYPRRQGKAAEAQWWGLSKLYREGIAKIRHLPITGILWYQGESNATTNVKPSLPLANDYMLETNLAIIQQLRPNKNVPFLMVGLPIAPQDASDESGAKIARQWEPYRAAQQKACKKTGAIYLDTFGAGLGDSKNVHPANKIPFAEMAATAAKKALRKKQ